MAVTWELALEENRSFGYWVRRRRKALDWTQAELGRRVGASAAMIRKIEADERRPSRELAELLAEHLAVPTDEREMFMRAARDIATVSTPKLPSGPVAPPAPSQPPPSNLPAPMTSMVNRVNDLAAVNALILRDDVRLLTLLGPPGMGKTRLAVQTARQVLPHFAHGAWFVDLSAVFDPNLVLPSIGLALGLTLGSGQSPDEQLKAELRDRHMLLVLDNFEQVVAGAAHGVAALLRYCAGMKILVTSRVRLDVYGEFEYPLPPMSLPPLNEELPPDDLLAYEAVQLFVARTRQHHPYFELTTDSAPLVAEICRRMDGLPLALELAAARTRWMQVDELAAALREASGRDWHALLHTSARDLPPRQQTLFNAIAWSYSLLAPQEQAIFRRLGVFTGSFDAPAVAAVCSGLVENEEALATIVERLADHNLVSPDPRGPARRRLLDMIREFTLAQMDEAENRVARQNHLRHFAERQTDWYAEWLDPAYLDAVEDDLDNYRAALRYALEIGDASLAHLLGASMGRFWERRGLLSEGRAVLAKIMALPGTVDPKARFAVIHEATILAWMQHDFAMAETLAAQAMAWARSEALPEAVIIVFNMLGRIFLEQARYEEADRVLSEAIELGRNTNPPFPSGMLSIQQGEAALAQGSLDRAETLTRQGLETVSETDLIPYCLGWNNLAEVALAGGDARLALVALRKVLPLAHLHSRRARIFLNAVAGLILTESPIPFDDSIALAIRLLSYVTTANERLGDPLSPMTRKQLSSRIEITRGLLSADQWRGACEEGHAWTQAKALAVADGILTNRSP